jgi:hypothetical protein
MSIMAKDLTAIRIDGNLIEGLKRIIEHAPKDSVYRDRSVNWLIGRAVEEFIERNDVKPAAAPGAADERAARLAQEGLTERDVTIGKRSKPRLGRKPQQR